MESEADLLLKSIQQLNDAAQSDDLPSWIVRTVQDFLKVDQVLLVAIEGQRLDPLEYSDSWGRQGAKPYSLDVIHRALGSPDGWWFGRIERNPSDSQLMHNILSCVSARIDYARRPIGVLYCDIREGNRRFSDEDATRLKRVGDLCAAYLNDHLQRKERNLAGRSGREIVDIDSVLLGETEAMRDLKNQVIQIAASSASVLIRGERGTGKEIIASLIHDLSDRRRRELVIVHCASLPRELLESELFGYERGAFTGAVKRRDGRVWMAEGGTLFFDEIGDIPIDFQVRLLRLLQARRYYRVGSDVPVGPIDVRFVFATNRELEKMMGEDAFRPDFFDRITMGRILHVPPLRDRLADIPLLATRFALPKGISREAIALLMETRTWPGNVRQLESVVGAAASACSATVVDAGLIANELQLRGLLGQAAPPSSSAPPPLPEITSAAEMRRMYRDGQLTRDELRRILGTFFQQHGTWSKVARKLGCSTREDVKSFQQWIFKLQLSGVLSRERP